MAELLERLARWDLHPDRLVTDTFALEDAARAYEIADAGQSGKVGIVMEG
jgi:threonine dehydrogenase-like Zn-dependent dehydrogenase